MNSDHEQSLADDEEIVSAVIIQEPVAPPMTAVECESQSADFQPDLIKDPPATWREIGAMILLVMLCDLTIYRGHGFAGYALLFATAPLLLALGAVRRALTIPFAVVVVMLIVLVLKLLWCGSVLLVVFGFGLLAAVAMTLTGQCPYVLELAMFVSQTIRSGWEAVLHYGRQCNRTSPAISSLPLINVILPATAFLIFSVIFVLANPDLFASISDRIGAFVSGMRRWMANFSPLEVIFWLVTAWLSLGLLRPWSGTLQSNILADRPAPQKPAPAPLFAAFRNTLLTVIGLFAVYLVYEFATLWFREFPQGFHYSGYAHEGAAWLTVALALATATLSMVFRGSVLNDPRLQHLRQLAWIWSGLNLMLALSVYNRLFIYIEFNGLTRMRMIGLFGISLVACGFILVIIKIARNDNTIWLVRRHLWALALAVYLFALTPVDTLVVQYNVGRILDGDEAPSVQMTVQTIGSEGVLGLQPLLSCRNDIIREGIQAMLANRFERAEEIAESRQREGWTTFQIADQRVLNGLRASQQQWQQLEDHSSREEAWQRFTDYAYQWY
ncbi:MAG TPA: DUF4173 domain-containing protein [Pirellulaceae bacterium]|jgi:uncharacterized membrane protein|nr:DUF4173 domain-containing protein [Pirellulaceae bacterium]